MDLSVFIPDRIAKLRQAKGVSARDMSLTMGQNANYINHIENRKMEPSYTGLGHICDYFGITAREFFDEGNPYPAKVKDFIEDIKQLDENELTYLAGFVKEIVSKRK